MQHETINVWHASVSVCLYLRCLVCVCGGVCECVGGIVCVCLRGGGVCVTVWMCVGVPTSACNDCFLHLYSNTSTPLYLLHLIVVPLYCFHIFPFAIICCLIDCRFPTLSWRLLLSDVLLACPCLEFSLRIHHSLPFVQIWMEIISTPHQEGYL